MNSFIFLISLLGFPDVSLNISIEILNSEGISGTRQSPLIMLEWNETANSQWK